VCPNRAPEDPLPPLVVVPHGGPHAVTITTYFHSYAFLSISYGFALLHVNYRGSTGFGSASLASLAGTTVVGRLASPAATNLPPRPTHRAGHIGAQDVSDVIDATQLVLSIEPRVVDEKRVGIVGGSHGGFLAAHMIGQYPGKVGAAWVLVCRVPDDL
jgi:acylaminoacyl-peptidase